MIAHVILFVRDQRASAAFYAALLGAAPRLDVPGMTEFDLGAGAVLGLMPQAGARRLLGSAVMGEEPRGDAAGVGAAARGELYLLVEEPAAMMERALALGARCVSEVRPRDWGHEAGYAIDPDRHLLAFARPISGS